jgi:alpha-mannosidase
MQQNNKKPVLYLMPCNHFDLAWRRAFRKKLLDNGKTYVSYSDLEQYYIEDNISFCEKFPEYKFQIESVHVAKEFLKNSPDKKEMLVLLAKQGRLYITGSGDNIIDSNMVLGETIVRNFVSGLLWVENNFGQKTSIAYRADAFGNSAQLPQILKGCETDYVLGISYSGADEKYWRGLDGSTIILAYIPCVGWGGGSAKYPPCKCCGGTGRTAENGECTECGGRGIDSEKADAFWTIFSVDEETLLGSGHGYVLLGPEESLPQLQTIEKARELKGKFDVEFTNFEEPLKFLEEIYKNRENPGAGEVHDGVELNPNNTGCYVTRIKTKQNLRRQEYSLLAAEALSVFAYLKNKKYPSLELDGLWSGVLYSAFHDVVTGTHVDKAYSELEEMWKQIDDGTSRVIERSLDELRVQDENAFTIINPTGYTQTGSAKLTLPGEITSLKVTAGDGRNIPVVELSRSGGQTQAEVLVSDIAPYSSLLLHVLNQKNDMPVITSDTEPVIQNERFLIKADTNGILSIYDKKLQREIAKADAYRPGEFILEHDEGSPWATLSSDRSQLSLTVNTYIKSVEKGAGYERIVFVSGPAKKYNQNDVIIEWSVTLTEGIERVDFKTTVRWDTYSQRLKIAFPFTFQGEHIYEIPYGFLNRKPYEPSYSWVGSNGDWPAVNWAGAEGKGISAAVLNKGTPSYTMTDGGHESTTLFLSVLRSPCIPTHLHEPGYYTMREWDGMLDTGTHTFEYSITAYDTTFDKSSVVNDAGAYNAGLVVSKGCILLPQLPAIHSGSAYSSALKLAENGKDIVMRLAEFRGFGGTVEIDLPDYVKSVQKVNFLERQGTDIPVNDKKASFILRPFEISSVLFVL